MAERQPLYHCHGSPTFLRRFAGRLGDESATASDDVVASLRVSRRARCVRLAEGGIVNDIARKCPPFQGDDMAPLMRSQGGAGQESQSKKRMASVW